MIVSAMLVVPQLDELKAAMRGLKKTDRRTLGSRPDLCRSDFETQRKRFAAAKQGEPSRLRVIVNATPLRNG